VTGLRTIQLNERLHATFADPGQVLPDEVVRTQTNNQLFGCQVGFDSVFGNRCNWCLERMALSTGIYGIFASAAIAAW